ncbi:hypothetical protein ACWEFJ_28475 [Actinosynnema sp. NPDC004786]
MPPEGRISDLADVLNRKFQEVKEQIRKTLFGAVISRGGLLIKDGGELIVETETGVVQFYLGEVVAQTTGEVLRGLVMRRGDGTVILNTRVSLVETGKHVLAWLDQAQNVLISDNVGSPSGLARPYLATPAARAKFTSWESTTSAAYEELWHIRHFRQHPKVRGRIYTTTDAAGTTGDWRIRVADTGEILATGLVSFAQGPTNWGPVVLIGNHLSDITLIIEARRTAGTGSVRIEHTYTAGVE